MVVITFAVRAAEARPERKPRPPRFTLFHAPSKEELMAIVERLREKEEAKKRITVPQPELVQPQPQPAESVAPSSSGGEVGGNSFLQELQKWASQAIVINIPSSTTGGVAKRVEVKTVEKSVTYKIVGPKEDVEKELRQLSPILLNVVATPS